MPQQQRTNERTNYERFLLLNASFFSSFIIFFVRCVCGAVIVVFCLLFAHYFTLLALVCMRKMERLKKNCTESANQLNQNDLIKMKERLIFECVIKFYRITVQKFNFNERAFDFVFMCALYHHTHRTIVRSIFQDAQNNWHYTTNCQWKHKFPTDIHVSALGTGEPNFRAHHLLCSFIWTALWLGNVQQRHSWQNRASLEFLNTFFHIWKTHAFMQMHWSRRRTPTNLMWLVR